MAKLDIYTYFTAEQTRRLLVASKSGTKAFLKDLKEDFPTDYPALVYAIADCMPTLVAEDRLYKSGPRRGQRKLMFRNITTDISSIIAQELTGCATITEFVRAKDYCNDRSMVETVLTPPVNSEQYAKLWIKTFLDDKQQGFPNLKAHYRAMTVEPMRRAQAAVDNWLANNEHDINEIMTWDSNKYNQWHFANKKETAE